MYNLMQQGADFTLCCLAHRIYLPTSIFSLVYLSMYVCIKYLKQEPRNMERKEKKERRHNPSRDNRVILDP